MKKYMWKVLMDRSSIQVKVRYMKIGLIIADFKKFTGAIHAGDHFKNPEIQFSIDAGSVNTHDKGIDKQICSGRFLSVKNYPQILFSAINGCIPSSGGILELTGNLSVKAITRPITLVVNSSVLRVEERKNVASFNLFGSISMKDFELECELNDSLEDHLHIQTTLFLQKID
ncbi:YceI family protein [Mucilaginibacter aquaedulcis]|uniref:YceI family protein n=1 Tax=Mucilaginibacter aquaedulcis TaxID=1187081 RepID=UPI0025B4F2C4|nr:YceI family protein [Mucilaginibacter aquaedulcis]MDN3548875.1 YceI family protein [Mucilaginibacter aquaedulcis]